MLGAPASSFRQYASTGCLAVSSALAEWLRRELTALNLADLHVELFDATHLAIEYRYPIGLRYLADRLR